MVDSGQRQWTATANSDNKEQQTVYGGNRWNALKHEQLMLGGEDRLSRRDLSTVEHSSNTPAQLAPSLKGPPTSLPGPQARTGPRVVLNKMEVLY